MKRITVKIAAAMFAAVCMANQSFCAYAATVDEVAEAARALGISEEDIQTGYSEYNNNPSAYPPERLDEVIAKLHETGGVIITTGQYDPNYVRETTTTVSSSETNKSTEIVDNSISLTADDGTVFTRISAEEFIAMSYDEKMAYISSFPQERQQTIINNLSPAEYKSLIKQSPAEKKVEIVNSLSSAADGMGLVFTVDEVSDDSLTLSMRNEEGKLLNVSSAGASVEDTGYDRRGIFAAIAAALITAAAGIVFLSKKCFGKDKA